jgi:plastocyanin
MKRTRFALVAALAALALAAAGCGGDDEGGDDTTTITETTDTTTDTETTDTSEAGGALRGSVGPGFDISLTTEDGEPVTALAPGTYELEIEDLSSAHNFHLTGPGADISTDVAEEGTQTVSLSVTTGSYSFVCDPHAGQMNGSFEVS